MLSSGRPARTALVLGAGGTVGIASHAGVLKALAEAGMEPAAADLVVGTSAGSVAGAILRAGHDIDDVWMMASEDVHLLADDQPAFRPDVIFRQGWRTPVGLARRLIGSGYVLHRSVLRWPPVQPPLSLQRVYRGGLSSVTHQRDELEAWTGEAWPEEDLWVCTVDIVTGRRLVLGQPGRPRPPVPDAVRASSSVPALYPPVRVGRRILVDGGVHSTTNLDVAVAAGAEFIVVAAPMAYDHADPPPPHLRALREFGDRRLERELRAARAAGVEVLDLRPGADEASAHGMSFMRSDDHGDTARAAHDHTAQALRTPAGRRFRSRWRAAVEQGRSEVVQEPVG
jgi:NTE family protein